jgi:hypothetical protein
VIRLFHRAAFWLCLFVLFAEGLSAWLSPYGEIPSATEAIRNPSMTRGWPEYTAGPRRPRRDLVVLVTHSQGVGRESAESSLIYPARVRQELSGRADFESYACGGLRTAELESLLVQAMGRGARLVLLAISPSNLDPPEHLSLRYPGTDAPLLAFELMNLPLSRHTLSFRHTSGSDRLVLAARSHSALLRSRTAIEDALTGEVPQVYAPMAFGRWVSPVERLDALEHSGSAYWQPPDAALLAFRQEQSEKGRSVRSYSAQDFQTRLQTLRDLSEAVRGLADRSGTLVLLVFSPFDPSRISPETRPLLERFFIEASAVLNDNQLEYVDFHSLLPASRFLTAGHLDETGHELFAAAMGEAINHALR